MFLSEWREFPSASCMCWVYYRGADKSLARPERKQANVYFRMAWNPSASCMCWVYYRGADKSLARPRWKQATSPAFYGTWKFITTFTTVHHLSLPKPNQSIPLPITFLTGAGYFLPGRAKDLSASLYITLDTNNVHYTMNCGDVFRSNWAIFIW